MFEDYSWGDRPSFLDELKSYLLNPRISELEIIKNIQEMSHKFTQSRKNISDYVMNENLVSSYAYFYLSTNLPKMKFLFLNLKEEIVNDFKNRTFIDVGTGPGTFSYAFLNLVGLDEKTEIIAVDSSPVMQKQAEKILKGFYPELNLKVCTQYKELNPESILFFGHSINEMGIDRALQLIKSINPKYVMYIEPGTSELFLNLKKMRSEMLAHFDVLYPCPSNFECPNNWCHQVLRTTHDPILERLSQLVSLDRKILPMTAHLYVRKENEVDRGHLINEPTIIRFLNETKFSFDYEICEFKDGKNQISKKVFLKKELSKIDQKNFKKLSVGTKISK